MSQTPVDSSDREGRTVREDDRGTESRSVVSRVASRIRSVGRSLCDRLLSVTDRPAGSGAFEQFGGDGRSDADDRRRSVQCVALTEKVIEEDGRAVADDLVRARTTEAADRDGPADDRPELAVERDDGKLTLRSPDDPQAHLTSTYWEEVER